MMVKTKENRKRLVLLDAHAILHRAYHALPDFSTSKGEPTGAIYGLSTMLIKIISELKPDYIAACYDLPGPTFRHEAYEKYKAQRKKAEDDLVLQMVSSRKIFEAFSIPIYEHPGFEADDMLGTIVEQLKKKNIDIIIASGDMDTMQLIDDDKVRVYTLKKGINDTILYNEKLVIERFGFPPKLLPDYKGLRGDPSDNIIGIAGIGEKTATDLIKNFGSIENIYKTLAKSRKNFEEAGIKERIINLLLEGKEEAEFSKTLATIRRDAPINFLIPDTSWREHVSIEKITQVFRDFEFRALVNRLDQIFGTESLALSVPKQEKVKDEGEIREVGVMLWVLNSNFVNPNLEDILHFAKTENLAEAKEKIVEALRKQNLFDVFLKIERPLMPILKRMHERGIRVDKEYLMKLSLDYHVKLKNLEKKIINLAGVEFNINSPKQLGEVIFEKMNLGSKNQKKTSTGQKSTRESELEKMRDTHPIIGEILAYRELQKLLSTYIDVLPQLIEEDGKLHAEFIQAGTTTGRFSSQNPNLQNIPTKTEQGKNIRHAFIASEGFTLVAFDYAQIELKIATFLSGDPKLIDIFRKGEDVHTTVAAQVFNVPPEMVDKEMRRRAKVINFGILYGMGVNALRENLGTSRAEAQDFYNQYFANFSGLANYLNFIKADAERKGYTETFFGRRRYFEGIRSRIPYIKAAAERMAINAPIQGTQADIVKIAMGEIQKLIEKEKRSEDVFLLLQIHDELIYEIRDDFVDIIAPEIQRVMEGVIPPEKISDIKLSTSYKKGKNWGELA